MEFRNYQESDRQKILDFYYENFCKNLPLVKIFGGIPDDELRINFEPTYGSMLEDGVYAYENNELVGAFSGVIYEFPKTDQPELNVPHSTMKNIILVLEQAEEPLEKYLNENAAPGDKIFYCDAVAISKKMVGR